MGGIADMNNSIENNIYINGLSRNLSVENSIQNNDINESMMYNNIYPKNSLLYKEINAEINNSLFFQENNVQINIPQSQKFFNNEIINENNINIPGIYTKKFEYLKTDNVMSETFSIYKNKKDNDPVTTLHIIGIL